MFHILCLLPPFSLPIQHSTELSYSEVLVCLHTSKLWDWGAAPHPCLSSGVCLASCTEGMFCASDPKGRLESQNCWILERERMSYPQRKCGKVSALCCCSSWGIEQVTPCAKGNALWKSGVLCQHFPLLAFQKFLWKGSYISRAVVLVYMYLWIN